jgi:diaminohydroxyphosphoribosylaminopyrimidine deaminase/5-amino-6-(5-phosphoribosylamino)uracil reductase
MELPVRESWERILAAAGRPVDETMRLAGDAAIPAPLWDIFAPLVERSAGGVFVIGQLGQSLDGRIATPTGHSRYINGPDGLRHLHRLRALVDAVVIGVGTAIADDPQLTVRDCTGRAPARVVIDPMGRLPDDARLLADDGIARMVIRSVDKPVPGGVHVIRLASTDGRFEPARIIGALAERGYRRILIEGGAMTISTFLAAGALDRLHVSVAPFILGSGPTGLSLPAIERVDEALRPEVSVHSLGSDLLFDLNFGTG